MNEFLILEALKKCGGKNRYVHSATVIGEIIANYTGIGDAEVYDNILNLSTQKKAPILIHAINNTNENIYTLAYRYTEIKISSHGIKLLKEIKEMNTKNKISTIEK